MSTEVPGLVESSVNFGVMTLMHDHLFCHLCARSSCASYLEAYQRTLSAYGALVDATNVENLCPGAPWEPNTDSALLTMLKRTHAEEFDGREPKVHAIHAFGTRSVIGKSS